MTVYFRPLAPKVGKVLDGKSTFFAGLGRAFEQDGQGRIVLTSEDARALRAMSVAVKRFDDLSENDYDVLADAVELHGSVEVWGEC